MTDYLGENVSTYCSIHGRLYLYKVIWKSSVAFGSYTAQLFLLLRMIHLLDMKSCIVFRFVRFSVSRSASARSHLVTE